MHPFLCSHIDVQTHKVFKHIGENTLTGSNENSWDGILIQKDHGKSKTYQISLSLSGIHSNSVGLWRCYLQVKKKNTENQCWWHCGHGLWALRTVTKIIYYIYKVCSLSYFLWQKGKEMCKFCIFHSWLSTVYVAIGIHLYFSCIYLYFYLAHIICSFNRYCCCSCLYSKSFSKKILKSGAFSPE